jgi:hypothetical protein
MANEKMPENADKYFCENCDFKCSKKSNYAKHLLTLKHKNANNANEKMLENADENADKYFCENCDFKCSKKSNFDKHLLTLKHNNVSEKMPENAENAENKSTCVCGKFFNHPSSLSRHKLKCTTVNIKTITNIMMDFMKSNKELQKQMLLEVCKIESS